MEQSKKGDDLKAGEKVFREDDRIGVIGLAQGVVVNC